MQVGEQILQILRVHIADRGHHAVALLDDGRNMLVSCWSTAVQIRMFEDSQQSGSMQRVIIAVVMALCTIGLEDLVSMSLFRI